MGVSARAGENIKSTKSSAVRDLMLVCNNIVSFEEFSILANGTDSLIHSFSLYLFSEY